MEKLNGLSLSAQFNRIVNKFNIVKKKKIQYDLGYELYPSEMQVLVVVSSNSGITVTSIAEELYITKSAASQLVGKLAKKEYIEKKRVPENERIVEIYLTGNGEKAVQSYIKFESKTGVDFLKHLNGLSSKEKSVVLELFKKLEDMMDEKLRIINNN